MLKKFPHLPYVIAAAFLVLSGFFVAKMTVYPELRRVSARPELALVSTLFVLAFALPSFFALLKWLGWQRGLTALLVLGAFALAIETFAVRTGVPYGPFTYGTKIGTKVFGAVPWTVPFAWTPLLLASMTLARRCTVQPYAAILLSALLLVAMDMVLDPGAVAQKFWIWAEPGAYYRVPLSNFIGWFLSGVVGSVLFSWLAESGVRAKQPPSELLGSAFLILVFWSSVCLWSRLWIAAIIGVALAGFVSFYLFQTKRTLRF
jgi:putative membrane protein